ncbi:hypothetical protein [Paraburkholderia sp. BL10I2N1]|uniref:hypothetical protein n=1 Tax=Paraburkholderia sp. BL10I2N1 TaxID=1938796 RepID=UPI00105BFF56|nr:hypothetical protein [Paraburkholderia sp. BL10I2N1]TDN62205.1 hypothetical protein B0G77_5748 [Paraburkholderia sp. BL10I2N1]
MKSPETLEEFETFIRVKGEAALTEEMRARRDELVAGKLRSDDQGRKAERASVSGVELSTDMLIVETKHTRDGHDLFVVKLGERVERSEFDKLTAATKRLGGYYSRYNRDGAVPGFQFKTREAAEKLPAVGRGETVGTAEAQAERVAVTESSAAEKLRNLAIRTQEAGESQLNRDRLTNTPKRALQASSAQEEARKDIALAKTMLSLADAIGSGSATHLDQLTDKAQVMMFEKVITDAKYREVAKTSNGYAQQQSRKGEAATLATIEYVEYPKFSAHASELSRLIDGTKQKPGLMRIAAKLKPYLEKAERSGDNVTIPDELARAIVVKLGRDDGLLPGWWPEAQDRRKSLERMGLTTPEQFRAAWREFLQFRQERDRADKATELERALVGKKVGVDYFPTPKSLCARLVEMANLRPGMRVLEPSAGNGNIADALRAAGYEPDVIEISHQLRAVLEAKQYRVIGWDFLEFTDTVDAIVMNPPFSGGCDIKHVRHAYSLLAEGGRLVAIVGEGAFYRSDAQANAFRDWLDEVGAEVEKLLEGTFTDRTLLQTTGANARVVAISR